jgi:hypothetical protein
LLFGFFSSLQKQMAKHSFAQHFARTAQFPARRNAFGTNKGFDARRNAPIDYQKFHKKQPPAASLKNGDIRNRREFVTLPNPRVWRICRRLGARATRPQSPDLNERVERAHFTAETVLLKYERCSRRA